MNSDEEKELLALQNKIEELNEKLVRKTREVDIIRSISLEILNTINLDDIFDKVLNIMASTFGFRHSMILLTEDEGEVLTVTASLGYDVDGIGAIVPLGQGMIGVVAKHKKLMRMVGMAYRMQYANTVKQTMGENSAGIPLPGLPDSKSQIAIPLLVQDYLIGVFFVESADLNAFKSLDEVILGIVANQIAVAIENAKAFNKVKEFSVHLENKIAEAVAEQEKYNQSLLELSKSKTIGISGLDAALKEVTELCSKILKLERCSIWLFNHTKDELKCLDLFRVKEGLHEKNLTFTASAFPAYFNYLKKENLLSAPDVYKHEGIQEFNDSYHKVYHIQSALDVPILSGGRIIGVISCEQIERIRYWTSEEENFVSSITNILTGYFELTERQEAYSDLAETKKEVEELSQFTYLINSLPNLNEIFIEISKYIYQQYKITGSWLLLPDESHEYLFPYKAYSYHKLTADKYHYLMNVKIPMKESDGGMIYKIFQTKKTFHLHKIPKFEFGIDREIAEMLSLKSLLLVPLVRKEESVGILIFSNIQEEMKLSKKEIRKLSNLCSQIAGAIDTNHLLQQVEKARAQADVARIDAEIEHGISVIAKMEVEKAKEEAEKAKKQMEFLNEFSKVINSFNNLEIIFSHAVEELCEKLDADLFILQLLDKAKNELFTRCISGNLTEAIFKKHSNLRLPLAKHLGSVSFTYSNKKTTYLPNLKRIRKDQWTDVDTMYQTDFRFNSAFQIPLLVQDEVIGILHINKVGGMRSLTKDEIRFSESLCEQLALAVNNSFLYEETEISRKETENLNELMKNINSVSSLTDIMSFLMYYLEIQLKFEDFSLLLNDEVKEQLSISSYVSIGATKEESEYFKNWKIPHRELSGIFAEIFSKRKIIFARKAEIDPLDKIAMGWLEMGDFEYLLLIPLVIYDELVGVFFVHASEKENPINDEILLRLERFAELIAGSIFNAKLLKRVEEAKGEAEMERNKSEKLLLNILPKDVARELKEKGFAEPELFENVSVMFTDFKGFTQIAETLTPQALIKDLDACFVQFDKITERVGLEKLKTIGDSYMCAGGIPRRNSTHAIDCCLAALEIQSFMNMMKRLKTEKGFPYWELRLGIHTGPLIAGVIGERKFAYDVWGDTVNTASRMESSGTPGRINISYTTYELVKDFFECEYRGEVNAKNKGVVKMYYLHCIKSEFSKDEYGMVPNEKFWTKFSLL